MYRKTIDLYKHKRKQSYMFETTYFALRNEVNFNSMNNNDITFHIGDRVIVGEDGGGQGATIVCEYGDDEFVVVNVVDVYGTRKYLESTVRRGIT